MPQPSLPATLEAARVLPRAGAPADKALQDLRRVFELSLGTGLRCLAVHQIESRDSALRRFDRMTSDLLATQTDAADQNPDAIFSMVELSVNCAPWTPIDNPVQTMVRDTERRSTDTRRRP